MAVETEAHFLFYFRMEPADNVRFHFEVRNDMLFYFTAAADLTNYPLYNLMFVSYIHVHHSTLTSMILLALGFIALQVLFRLVHLAIC